MKRLAVVSVMCLLRCPGLCATYFVAPDGSGDYTTIQSAVNAAQGGDVIIVRPGLYIENIEFPGIDLILASEDPPDWAVVEQTIIKAKTGQSVVTFSGSETPACRLEGFTIQDGFTQSQGGGIFGNSTQATIRRCIIKNNTALGSGGGLQAFHGIVESCFISGNTAVYGGAAAGCNADFINCIVAANQAEAGGLAFNNCDGAISLCTVAGNAGGSQGVVRNCDGTIENSILWDNMAISFSSSSAPSHCCFPGADGTSGNINQDPRFVFPGDYHLRIDSPCIDAGTDDPPSAFPDFDYYGQTRVVNATGLTQPVVDMGAAEFDPAGPLIVVSRHSATFSAVAGQTAVQTADFLLANAGGGQFDWAIESTPAWLTAVPDSGISLAGHDPNTITLIADANGLSPGRYPYTLFLNAPQALNSPLPVSVELVVVCLNEIRVPQIFETIQDAIDAAVDGSRIVVADGVYTGPYNRDLDFCGKQIVLESENGPEKCIIDCLGQGRGFYFHNGEDANSVVRGFTIRNGLAIVSYREINVDGGGGMLVKNSSPCIINCRFSQNQCIAYEYLPTLTVIMGEGGGLLLFNSDAQVTGCSFTENQAYEGGAVCIYNEYNVEARSIIKNCIMSGNTASVGAGIYSSWTMTAAQISFCTIVGNRNLIYEGGSGIYGGNLHIKNSILWGNGSGGEYAQINENFLINYSCVQGWTGQLGGIGNFGQVPKFVKPGYWLIEESEPYQDLIYTWIEGDYHLQSEGWRWDRQAGRWTYDDVTSPCIDTGNPADELGEELPYVPIDPTGIFGKSLRVNMGAYGGTDQASLAPAERLLLTDLTNDGTADLEDLIHLSSRWLRHDYDSFFKAKGTDFTRDNVINLPDLACLSAEWMKKKPVKDPVAHWTFDEDWLDTTGAIPGTPMGGALITHSFTKVGLGAAYFDGIDDAVVMAGFKGVCGQSDRTVCFWMNTTGLEEALLGWGSFEEYAKWLLLLDAQEKFGPRLQGGNVTTSAVVNDGLWHHVAVVLNVDGAEADTADIAVYIDGLQVEAQAIACPIDTEEFYDLCVGWFEETDYYYEGFIDDLRIYDTALNPWQIEDIFSGNE